ncbi:MAG TPA: FAD-binding oxidoreductase [Solirubrobacterales bacterium]
MSAVAADLSGIVGAEFVREDIELTDASGMRGSASVLTSPGTAEEVAAVVAWAYERDLAIVPVGGSTGYSGGIVPEVDAPAVAIALHRLDRVRSFEPRLWRAEVEAGVTTATVARLARNEGLMFGPDPGAAQTSQIGGNLATNAGGPHAFGYGVISQWVTGIEAVLAPGELARFGGPIRKDVAGYDLKSLLIGSEGTLGVITAAWLRLAPAPEQELVVYAVYDSVEAGVEAVHSALGSGAALGAVEFLQGTSLRHSPPPFLDSPAGEFLVICETHSRADQDKLLAALGSSASAVEADVVWGWRKGVSLVVRAVKGEKIAEDISVPLDRLGDAIRATMEIGEAHGLEATSWGHAGDGNIHSTYLFDPNDPDQVRRAELAAEDLFDLARSLGGSVSGEHGIGKLKRGQLAGQWSDVAVRAHEAVKDALDPKGLFNPGTKEPRPDLAGER